MTEKRFGMYQNILYDDGNILNPFDAMKLLNHFDKENTKLKEENEQLKKDRFICLDCEHSGYVEIGCLCEYNDSWQDHITECEDFKGLRE